MPASYAHTCYGKMVYRELPGEIRRCIRLHPQAYLVGLHGPDLFFFYKPYLKNKIAAIGHRAHQEEAFSFFCQGRGLAAGDGVLKAYLMGFLCHFALDSVCHPYVSRYEELHGVRHSDIETELDRALMQERGKNPLLVDRVAHLRPSRRLSRKIAQLFPGTTPEIIQDCMRGFQRYSRLLICRSPRKEALLRWLFGLGGKKFFVGGMIMGRKVCPGCQESTEVLMNMVREAVPLGRELVTDFYERCRDGKPLDPRLKRNYK